jgi:hypothetical protein
MGCSSAALARLERKFARLAGLKRELALKCWHD